MRDLFRDFSRKIWKFSKIFHEKVYMQLNFQNFIICFDAFARSKCAETLEIWSTHEYNIFWEFGTLSWEIWAVSVLKISMISQYTQKVGKIFAEQVDPTIIFKKLLEFLSAKNEFYASKGPYFKSLPIFEHFTPLFEPKIKILSIFCPKLYVLLCKFFCAKADWTSLREANALKLWEYEVLTSTTYWESLRHIGHFHEKYERLLWRNFRFFSQYTLIFRSIFWGKTAPKKFCPEILEF